MGKVILFPSRPEASEDEFRLDLLTAIDVAIRDLRDIAAQCGEPRARNRADECRQMPEEAFELAVEEA